MWRRYCYRQCRSDVRQTLNSHLAGSAEKSFEATHQSGSATRYAGRRPNVDRRQIAAARYNRWYNMLARFARQPRTSHVPETLRRAGITVCAGGRWVAGSIARGQWDRCPPVYSWTRSATAHCRPGTSRWGQSIETPITQPYSRSIVGQRLSSQMISAEMTTTLQGGPPPEQLRYPGLRGRPRSQGGPPCRRFRQPGTSSPWQAAKNR